MSAGQWRDLYPFASYEMQLGSLRYHYLDENQPAESGETLLMVHGNPTWSFYWRNLIRPLRKSHRVVAVDHIGCGLSDKPQDYPYTLAQHSANLVKLIEHLDLTRITLVCHDWGGAIGLGAALAARARFARIVLFNTAAFPPPFIPRRIAVCRWPLFGPLVLRRFNAFSRAALSMAVEKPERMTANVSAGLLAPYDNWGNRVAVNRFVQDIPRTPKHPTWEVLAETERQLPTLSELPVQLIWGMRDWCFTPACLERFIKIFPSAEAHRFEDSGHYVVEDAHERIVPLLSQFIENHPIESQAS